MVMKGEPGMSRRWLAQDGGDMGQVSQMYSRPYYSHLEARGIPFEVVPVH